jgi:RNA polymerase sigma-70 factor, ECF subfamily
MRTDEDLMECYQRGEEEAFNELYRRYSPRVFGYIKKRLHSSEAEDFFQKVWRHLHEKKSLYRNQPFAPWFFFLMKNLLIDEYRSLGKKEVSEFRILQNDLSSEIDELLEKVSPENAELIKKYYLEGHSYHDLQSEYSLSEATLRQRLSRSLRSLKNLVGKP